MNTRILIDGIVQQTTVLIAQLATSGGLRAPLAHVAGQAFLGLAKELERQGVGKKVSADMFGLALRTYQRRTQRLVQSQTDRGRSLWATVLEFVGERGPISREQVLRRFQHDDEGSVRGVLRDLTESGLVFVAGSGRSVTYRRAAADEVQPAHGQEDELATEALVWSVVFREQPISEERLAELCRLDRTTLSDIVESLSRSGRIERDTTADPPELSAHELVLGLDHPAGWEAAVLDHFSAVVRTIATKLRDDQRASKKDAIGGSTYHFALWRGHPLEGDVVGELGRFRERMTTLRDRIDRYNEAHAPEGPRYRVDAYYGQTELGEGWDDEDHEDHEDK